MASEYGWAKRDIYEDVYFDELFALSKQIEKRKLQDWRVQLAIVQNPHLKGADQKKLWDSLQDTDEMPNISDTLDKDGVSHLKALMQGGGIKIK